MIARKPESDIPPWCFVGAGGAAVSNMEPRLASEVAHGAVGMSRLEGNEIVRRLLTKYEKDIPQAPKGEKYQECWNIQSKQPKPEYLELYHRIKQELAECGIRFKNPSK